MYYLIYIALNHIKLVKFRTGLICSKDFEAQLESVPSLLTGHSLILARISSSLTNILIINMSLLRCEAQVLVMYTHLLVSEWN